MNTRSYMIPASNLPRLEGEIAKLNKRATKLQRPPVQFEILREVRIEREDSLGFKYSVVYFECKVAGEAPRINGWQLVAMLEPTQVGEMVVREVPGQSCPTRFRTTDLHCDHCQSVRRRNAIFVLRCVEEGQNQHLDEHRQVGRDCLADFLGHTNPQELLAGAEFIISVGMVFSEAEAEEWAIGSRWKPGVPVERFVSIVSILCRRLGWVPRSKALMQSSTADTAWDICTRHDQGVQAFIRKHELYADKKDIELAQAAITWARNLGSEDTSTYLYNVGALCREANVSYKNIGYLASVIDAYRKHKADDLRKEGAISQFVGVVKKRQVFDLLVQHFKTSETPFGPKTFVRFLDPEGNLLVWFASGSPEWLEIGKRFIVKATVKAHERYCEVNRTVVERVSLLNTLSQEINNGTDTTPRMGSETQRGSAGTEHLHP